MMKFSFRYHPRPESRLEATEELVYKDKENILTMLTIESYLAMSGSPSNTTIDLVHYDNIRYLRPALYVPLTASHGIMTVWNSITTLYRAHTCLSSTFIAALHGITRHRRYKQTKGLSAPGSSFFNRY